MPVVDDPRTRRLRLRRGATELPARGKAIRSRSNGLNRRSRSLAHQSAHSLLRTARGNRGRRPVLPRSPRSRSPWLPWFGAGLLILGIAVSVAGKRHFQRVGTNVYTFEEPGELVTDGPYRFSRNPMYLGLVLAGIGAALVSASLSALVLAAAFAITVRCWYIAFEERAMRRQFGDAYEAYCRQGQALVRSAGRPRRTGSWLRIRRSRPDRKAQEREFAAAVLASS